MEKQPTIEMRNSKKPQNLEKIGTKQEIFVEKILINGVMYKQVQLRNT